MVIDIKKCNLRTATPNDFKGGIREIVQSLENYVNKDLEKLRVLVFIEDDSTETDTSLSSHFSSMAWNLKRGSVTNWLVAAALNTIIHTLLVLGGIWVFFAQPYADALNITTGALAIAFFTTITTNPSKIRGPNAINNENALPCILPT